MDEIPSFSEFIALQPDQVKGWARKFGITTAYYAVDGTRRHIHGILGDDFTIERYYGVVQSEFLKALSHFITAGFENIVVLIWDVKVFDRGNNFVKISFEKGIRGTFENEANLEFYRKHDLRVYYSGFNDMYEGWDVEDLIHDMKEFERSTLHRKGPKLFYHTADTHSGDVVKIVESAIKDGLGVADRDTLVRHVYGEVIPDVDAAFYFGKPREKISPILLMNDSVRFYSKAPSLAMSWEYMVRSIYYTIMHKFSINDSYNDYHIYEPYSIDVEFEELMWGEKSYLYDLLKPRSI